MLLSRILFLTQWLVLVFLPGLAYSAKELKYSQVRPNMQTIMHYHIENKEFSSLIVKRSFKVYLEQFDPEKLYLLKDEVKSFLDLNEKDIALVIRQYDKDRFDEYIKMNHMLQKSIDRHRAIREEAIAFILKGGELQIQSDNHNDYASSEKEIKERIIIKYQKIIMLRERRAESSLDNEKKLKLLNLYEKRLRRHESAYYVSDERGEIHSPEVQEHYQSLHVLKAVTKSLDAHSAYYSAEEAAELRAALKKQFEGVGVVLKETEEGVCVADLITGGPAYESRKIHIGDVLIAIDGLSIKESSFDEILEKLRGEEGSVVELTFKTSSSLENPVKLKREKILLNEERLSYTYEPYADGVIGKIVLPGFYDNGEGVNSEKDLREAIKDLKSKGTLYGLVIDMRENSGGFLSQAVKVSGLFITKGVIVISKYSDGEIRYMRDLDGRMYYQGPLVLLTSKASASAAEIVAQALQDYGVAVIAGDERTYGKGSMQYQTVTEEDAKIYFKVTVGKYYTISGKSTQIEGVKADILVPTAFAPYNIGEKYLEYPLSNDHLDIEVAGVKGSPQKTIQKKYLPQMQQTETIWVQMIPSLKKNSEYRIGHDKNYQFFLQRVNGGRSTAQRNSQSKKSENSGSVDLQTKEAVNIVKDMIYMSQAS